MIVELIMDERFQIIQELFRGTDDLISHHRDSYERFITIKIPSILREISPIKIPLVQKTKAQMMDKMVERKEEAIAAAAEGETAAEAGAAAASAAGAAGAVGSEKAKERVGGIEFAEEDVIDANTYSEFDAVVSIYIGGKDGNGINIYKPILVDKENTSPMLPNEARLRGFSYTSSLTVNVTIRILNLNTGEAREETLENLPFADIPIMVRSSACWTNNITNEALREAGEDPDDPGGYFIIGGAERVLVTQERVIPNLAYVNSIPEVMMACSQPDSTKVKILRVSFGKRGIVASVPGTKGLVPVGILFRALGVISDQEIVRCIFGTHHPDAEETDIIRSTLAASHGIYDQHSAIRLLTHVSRGLTIASAHGIVHRQLFPQQVSLPEKAALLGDLVRMLIHRQLKRIPDTDRDSTKNKSLAVTGTLMSEIFSTIVQTREEDIRKKISSEYNYNYLSYKDDNVFRLIPAIVRTKNDIFGTEENTSLLLRSMKGQWGADPKRGIPPQADGVSQALDRLTYTSALSHLRRVVLERVPQGKALLARRLHMSSFGYICPSETPSGGPKIGVVKNLAILASVSAGVNAQYIKELLYTLGVAKCNYVTYEERHNLYRVNLNGILLGYTDKPEDICNELRSLRRSGLLHPTVSISLNRSSGMVWIGSGPGRLLRPLIRIKDGVPMIREAIAQLGEVIGSGGEPQDVFSGKPFTSDNPVRKSSGTPIPERALELLDPWEIEHCLIANYPSEVTPTHTHCEIHASTMFGVMGCLIPFAPHNQGPRNIYSCAQSKQGTSMYSKAFLSRYDHSAMVLTSLQKPLVSTWYGRRIANGMLAYGTNLVVGIACFSGYNQEDGVIVNRSSVERGLFRVLKISEEASEEEDNRRTNTTIRFRDPRKYGGIKLKEKADYSYLDSDGLLPEGTMIKPNMVIIGRVAEQEGELPRDVSVVAGKFAGGMVDSRAILRTSNGLRKVRYRITKMRAPELGDKFSSRAGQKGTNGMLISDFDMPRTAEGIVPDLIVNPHAIPSRMTIGQLQESILGKLTSLIGCEADSTAFTQSGVFSEHVGRLLKNAGYNEAGDEIMYSGITGEALPTKVFIGPTYYMRLKHMSQDKINYRGGGVERGAVDARTRQPVGGRAREGGLRIGEMERDSIISHGTSMFLRESLGERADGESGIICANSGKRGFYGEHGYRSVEVDGPLMEPVGDTKSNTYSEVNMARSMTVLLGELETMGIDTRIVTDSTADRVRYTGNVRLRMGESVKREVEQGGKGRGTITRKPPSKTRAHADSSKNKTHRSRSKGKGKDKNANDVTQRKRKLAKPKKEIDKIGEGALKRLETQLKSNKDKAALAAEATRILEQKGLSLDNTTKLDVNLLDKLVDRMEKEKENKEEKEDKKTNLITSLKIEGVSSESAPSNQTKTGEPAPKISDVNDLSKLTITKEG